MLQFIVVGLVFGSIYALAASGLVITYVSTGVLNFAFGAFAFFIARFYYFLHVEKEWGILLSAAVSLLVLAPFMGIFFYMAIFRFLRLSSQLIKVVVTIGLSVVIPVLAVMIFGNDEIFQAPGLAPQPVSVYKVFDTAVTLDQVIAYACVLGIVVFGALILRYTEAGLSVRAMVDSEAMTSLSGSNPSRIAAGVWVISTMLAGLAGILAAPVIGLDSSKYTLLIAAAFAAVIAARLRSLPIAVFVGLLMGVAGSLVQYFLPPDSDDHGQHRPVHPVRVRRHLADRQHHPAGRVNEEEGVGGALDRAITPNGGSRLAASSDSENVYPKLNFTFPIIIFAAICILPLIFAPYWQSLMVTGVALAVVFLSYTLVTGEGGMLWLCQITFAGVGALSSAQFATVHGWPIIPSILMGGVIAGLIGVVIGLLTIRLGNLYIALVTLTFGLLMERLVFNLKDFANFGAGVAVARPEFVSTDKGFIYFGLGVFAIFAILIVNLRRSTTGLALNAVRWSENASRTMGLSVITMKMLVSGLAAFVAGVGGGLYALSFKQAIPLDYATILGLVWLAVLVTFGVRSNIAALLAGLLFTFSPAFIQTVLKLEAPWSDMPVLLFGLGAIALAQNPEGTVHQWAMGLQRMLHKASGGGARPVPAATGFAGRHDPRLNDDEPPPPPPESPQPDGTTAEVAGS